ncbi:MAG: hypothetical protein ACPLPT_09610 [Moorellales bacterium]
MPIWMPERLLQHAGWLAEVQTAPEQRRLWPPAVGAPRPEELEVRP